MLLEDQRGADHTAPNLFSAQEITEANITNACSCPCCLGEKQRLKEKEAGTVTVYQSGNEVNGDNKMGGQITVLA